jgi:hypothetical protein
MGAKLPARPTPIRHEGWPCSTDGYARPGDSEIAAQVQTIALPSSAANILPRAACLPVQLNVVRLTSPGVMATLEELSREP